MGVEVVKDFNAVLGNESERNRFRLACCLVS